MDNINPILREVVCNVIKQHRALMSTSDGERQKYVVIIGRCLADAAGMLREGGICMTLAGMRVIINEYTASAEVVREE